MRTRRNAELASFYEELARQHPATNKGMTPSM